MRRSLWIFGASLLTVAPTVVAFDPCSAAGPYVAPAVGAVGVVFGSNVPSQVKTGVRGGMDSWGENSCLDSQEYPGLPGFPRFFEDSSLTYKVTIQYVDGFGPLTSNGSTICGKFSGSNGNGTITLYSKTKFGSDDNGGAGYACPSATAQGAQRLAAHEMGHYLGLDNVFSGSCASAASYVMGPVNYNVNSSGKFTGWNSNSLAVGPQPNECRRADQLSTTPQEEQAEVGQCDQGLQNCNYSPIIIDYDHNGLSLTSAEGGVRFDLDTDGHREAIAWTKGSELDGFLWLDRDGDGKVGDGSELFGNFTPLLAGGRAPNGFAALAEYDLPEHGGDGNGYLDSSDAIYPELHLWFDWDHNGISDDGESLPLIDAGVTLIDLRVFSSGSRDRHGNYLRFRSRVWIDDGQRALPSWAIDVFFQRADTP